MTDEELPKSMQKVQKLDLSIPGVQEALRGTPGMSHTAQDVLSATQRRLAFNRLRVSPSGKRVLTPAMLPSQLRGR